MILKKTFEITSWPSWDDDIDDAAELFREIFAIFPNILLGNENTLKRFDVLANMHNERIKNEYNETCSDNIFAAIGVFSAGDYELELCIDNNQSHKEFVLIYDSDPDDGGEPLPENDSDLEENLGLHFIQHILKRSRYNIY